jgi:predicted CopG family antitoxin
MENLTKDAIILKRIETCDNYEWLKEMIKNKFSFSQVILKRIQKIQSLELVTLLKENYNI